MQFNRCENCVDGVRKECLDIYTRAVVIEGWSTSDSLERAAITNDPANLLEQNSIAVQVGRDATHEKLGKIGCTVPYDEMVDNMTFLREEIRKRRDGR